MNNTEFEQKKLKAIEAIEFLGSHPAIQPNIFGNNIADGIHFYPVAVCKNGYTEWAKHGITIYKDTEMGEKFKSYLEKEWEEEAVTDPELQGLYSAEVPYEVVFGQPWSFDHVEYWCEVTFFTFEGNPYGAGDDFDYKNWGRYGTDYSGDFELKHNHSFEDMIIEVAEKVKLQFGDFNSWKDFMTREEVINHEMESPIDPSEPIEDKPGFSTVIFNDKHVSISTGLRNLRWLKWYIEKETEANIIEDWGKDTLKQWKENIAKIDTLMPKERKTLLAQYK